MKSLVPLLFIGMIVGYSGALLAGGARASVGAQPAQTNQGRQGMPPPIPPTRPMMGLPANKPFEF